jgi:hypothetical protein
MTGSQKPTKSSESKGVCLHSRKHLLYSEGVQSIRTPCVSSRAAAECAAEKKKHARARPRDIPKACAGRKVLQTLQTPELRRPRRASRHSGSVFLRALLPSESAPNQKASRLYQICNRTYKAHGSAMVSESTKMRGSSLHCRAVSPPSVCQRGVGYLKGTKPRPLCLVELVATWFGMDSKSRSRLSLDVLGAFLLLSRLRKPKPYLR